MWEYQRRSRGLLHLSPQRKRLLAGRLENNTKSAEDEFPSTAKGCPGMSHSGTFQPNLPYSHQGICRQKGFIYNFSWLLFFPLSRKYSDFDGKIKMERVFFIPPLCFCHLNNFFRHCVELSEEIAQGKARGGEKTELGRRKAHFQHAQELDLDDPCGIL